MNSYYLYSLTTVVSRMVHIDPRKTLFNCLPLSRSVVAYILYQVMCSLYCVYFIAILKGYRFIFRFFWFTYTINLIIRQTDPLVTAQD